MGPGHRHADTARLKWRQRPEVCSLTSTRWLSSVRRLALADIRRGELVDGERPEVKQRGAPPLHTSRAVRLGLLALETTRAHPPATLLEQHMPGEHTVALPYVTTTRCPQICALEGRPCRAGLARETFVLARRCRCNLWMLHCCAYCCACCMVLSRALA